MALEVGPFDDGKIRLDFLLSLEKNGVKIRQAAKSENKVYTRIWTKTMQVKDWQDEEELLDKMTKLYESKDLKTTYEKLIKTIKEFSFLNK